MKRLALVMLIMAIVTPAMAGHREAPVVNNITEVTEVNQTIEHKNSFDYGAYLDAILLETANTEWGLHSTYLVENSETRVYAGGKVYINRLFKK